MKHTKANTQVSISKLTNKQLKEYAHTQKHTCIHSACVHIIHIYIHTHTRNHVSEPGYVEVRWPPLSAAAGAAVRSSSLLKVVRR